MLINEGCISCAFCVRVRRHDVGDRVGFISSDERKSIKSNNLDFLKYEEYGSKGCTESISCYRTMWKVKAVNDIDGFWRHARFKNFCNKYMRYREDFREGKPFFDLETESKEDQSRNLWLLGFFISIVLAIFKLN